MNIVVVGVSHKTAPVETRERLMFPEEQLERFCKELIQLPGIEEGVILSTCNRIEIYAAVEQFHEGVWSVKEFIARSRNIPLHTLEQYLYAHSTEQAVKHLFRVSSALDSMVVGEAQILGQVKDAYSWAKKCETVNSLFYQLFEQAFSVAKRVRSETGIGENAVSVSFAAVELAKKIFDTLSDKVVMLIGAGKMSELAARHLISQGVKQLFVSNRTFSKASEMAALLGGQALSFDQLKTYLVTTDIVISSTGSPSFIVKKSDVQDLIRHRRNKPMFFIDIAVPRDIDPEVNEIENVYLYDIDDLQSVVEANLREREREALKAEEIVTKGAAQFLSRFDTFDLVPTIVSLRDKVEKIRSQELERTLARLKGISDEEKEVISALTTSIVNKILHEPTVNIKKQVDGIEKADLIKVIKALFNLDR